MLPLRPIALTTTRPIWLLTVVWRILGEAVGANDIGGVQGVIIVLAEPSQNLEAVLSLADFHQSICGTVITVQRWKLGMQIID